MGGIVMTPEEQRIAIAEACGFIGEFSKRWILEIGMEGEDKFVFAATRNHLDEEVPDYLNDLNAMHEAEKVLTPDRQEYFVCVLDRMLHGGRASDLSEQFLSLHATAAQRAEAFLRTIGKWEESA
jgi:hypothetical protein